jgi:hypothetical protein
VTSSGSNTVRKEEKRKTHISDNQIDAARVATNGSVQRSGPDLAVRTKFEDIPRNFEKERLKIFVLCICNFEETSRLVRHGARSRLVFVEGV